MGAEAARPAFGPPGGEAEDSAESWMEGAVAAEELPGWFVRLDA